MHALALAAGAVVLCGAALIVAVYPATVTLLVLAIVTAAVAAIAVHRTVWARTLALLLAATLAGLCFALWPATTVIALIAAGSLLLAANSPPAALVAALGLVGLEGVVKLLVTKDPAPFASGSAIGAAAIDLALAAAVIAVVVRDGGATPRRLWRTAGRAERIVIVALGAWLALSVLEVVQSDPARGVAGFRLTQAYVAVALASAIAFAPPRGRGRERPLLAVLGALGVYAAVRVVTGPTGSEIVFALSKGTFGEYPGAFRAIGSFSGATPLMSYLTPAAVFCLSLALLDRRLRLWGALAGGCAVIAIVATYGRTPLLALAAGLLITLVMALAGTAPTRRRVLAMVGLTVALVGMGTAGAIVASHRSTVLRDRLSGIIHPGSDSSLNERRANWRRELNRAASHPLGAGLGTIGAASGHPPVTTDNSYIKVLVEQGFLGATLFGIGLLGALALLARRLLGMSAQSRIVGVAALSGTTSFWLLSITGEYIEQPGKAIAWSLLGIAAAHALYEPGVDGGW